MERKRGLIRPQDVERLRRNHQEVRASRGQPWEWNHAPVVKLYLPFTGCVWLLSEMESDELAFGLCDLGLGFPELGDVWLPEIEALDVRGLRVLQDVDWRATKSLKEYADEARIAQRIVA